MADEIVVGADSSSGAEAATGDPGQAATPTDETHGAETNETPTDAGEAESPDGADLDDDEDASSEDQTEEEKSKAQKRRERRQARDDQRVQERVDAAIAKRDAERETQAVTDRQAADAQAAGAELDRRFGALIGTPEVHASLNNEITALTAEVANMRPYAEGTDFDILDKKQAELNEKIAERNRLQANKATFDELDEFQFLKTKVLFFARTSSVPESHRASYTASTTVEQALDRLETGIVAREQAKADARAAAIEAEWRGKLAKEEAAHAATRTGAPGAGPSPNGSNGTGGGGSLTPERYRSMSFEERQTLKSTAQGRAQIDSMTARQLAAR